MIPSFTVRSYQTTDGSRTIKRHIERIKLSAKVLVSIGKVDKYWFYKNFFNMYTFKYRFYNKTGLLCLDDIIFDNHKRGIKIKI